MFYIAFIFLLCIFWKCRNKFNSNQNQNSVMKKEAIAQDGITQGAISKILKRNLQMGTPTPRRRSGRPRETSQRIDRQLLRMVGHDR